jgi:cytosine/uracil/thiamine/allantoin permease
MTSPLIIRIAAGLLCFFLYWMGQTCLALMPIQKLRILFIIKAIIVPPTFLALFLWAAIVTGGGGPLVKGETQLTSTYMNTAYSALTGLNVIIGYVTYLFEIKKKLTPQKFIFKLGGEHASSCSSDPQIV